MDGIGATEMLHIFIGSPQQDIRAGSTGRSVPGYEARVIDDDGRTMPPGIPGRLAVRGPDRLPLSRRRRQHNYVQSGWNITGDTYVMDKDGYFWYQARSDDMIISAGYNIAGPEVESVLLRTSGGGGMRRGGGARRGARPIVKAYVVLRPGLSGDAVLTRALQEHVKATIAPFKYPRVIEYVTVLPRTQTGKLQRFELRRIAAASCSQQLAS